MAGAPAAWPRAWRRRARRPAQGTPGTAPARETSGSETLGSAQAPLGQSRLPTSPCCLWFPDKEGPALSARTPTRGPPGQAGRRTHPLGGRNPEAVLLHVETAGGAHLCDEVQVPSVLRLPTLAPLELPDEVEEAAGQDEEAAAVGRPAKTTSSTETERPE